VLLGVHRGGRQKQAALRQLAEAVIADPQTAGEFVPVIAVAVRSVRRPEQAAGLAALARIAAGLSQIRFSPDLTRERVSFDAPLRNPLRFREAISALHDVVISNLRFTARDKSAYEEWKRGENQRIEAVRRAAQSAAKEESRQEFGEVSPELEQDHRAAVKRYWKTPRRELAHTGTTYHAATGPRALPQGACTSPALSNLIVRQLDRRLLGLANKLGHEYTRYADDMSFSAKSEDSTPSLGYLMARVRHIVQDEGFAVNEKKTRVLRPNASQRVTGIVVNDRLNVPRKTIRQLRAILHQARFTGLDAQNRENPPEFRAWLLGMIAYVSMVNPSRAIMPPALPHTVLLSIPRERSRAEGGTGTEFSGIPWRMACMHQSAPGSMGAELRGRAQARRVSGSPARTSRLKYRIIESGTTAPGEQVRRILKEGSRLGIRSEPSVFTVQRTKSYCASSSCTPRSAIRGSCPDSSAVHTSTSARRRLDEYQSFAPGSVSLVCVELKSNTEESSTSP